MKENAIKAMIGDDSAERGGYLSTELRRYGIDTCIKKNSIKSMLSGIRRDMPDTVIVHLSLSDGDAPELITRCSELPGKMPVFVVVSEIKNSFIERQVKAAGAKFFVTEPVDAENLSALIKSAVIRNGHMSEDDPDEMLTRLLSRLGVEVSDRGYQYLRTAVLGVVSDRTLLEKMRKRLYSYVAERHNVTVSMVDSAIHNTITDLWSRREDNYAERMLGITFDAGKGYPKNIEFIAAVADRMRLYLRSCTDKE